MSTTPQNKAAEIFGEVISELTSTSYDLVTILRRCQFTCELVGLDTDKDWFHSELTGYQQGTAPSYRYAGGSHIWQASGNQENERKIQVYVRGLTEETDPEPAILEIYAGVHWIIDASKSGYFEHTDDESKFQKIGYQTFKLERFRNFPAANIARVLREIEHIVYDFACSSYIQLQYGNMLTDIWTDYRTAVDTAIRKLDLSSHLEAIQSGLLTENPESWRAAVLECRNLLDDVANYLWQDQRGYYEHLPGDKNGRLDVTQGKSKNRYGAYLHQKGVHGTGAKFNNDEMERLYVSISTLIEYQSTGHSPVEKEQARSIALATYFILGELVMKTDMEPVTEYSATSA